MAWGIQDMPREDWLCNSHGLLSFETEAQARERLATFPKIIGPSRFAPVNAQTYYPSGRPGTAYAEREARA
jgi:hypothetical protein